LRRELGDTLTSWCLGLICLLWYMTLIKLHDLGVTVTFIVGVSYCQVECRNTSR
jgi:hypothetical protein